MGPLVEIQPEGILYTHVHPEDCEEILERRSCTARSSTGCCTSWTGKPMRITTTSRSAKRSGA